MSLKMFLRENRFFASGIAALWLFCAGIGAHAVDYPEKTKMDIAAWDAYAMGLSSGGRKGCDLLVWSVAIGGPGGRAAAMHLLSMAPTGADLDYVILSLQKRWKATPDDHRLPVLALDLAAAGGGSPLIPDIWDALAEAGEKAGVLQGELWKLWNCGLVCCSYGYASPAFFGRLAKLLNDEKVPLPFRLDAASAALNACRKAILFRQLEGKPAAPEWKALLAARELLAAHVADYPNGIVALKGNGGEEILRAICRDPRQDPRVRVRIAGVIGELGVLEDPQIKGAFPADLLRRFRTAALIRQGRVDEAERLAGLEKDPELKVAFFDSIARKKRDYRVAKSLLAENREKLRWEFYCNEMLKLVHWSSDRAAFEALQAEHEKRLEAEGRAIPPADFNNFFYTGLELGVYDGKLTPELLEQLEEQPRSAETLDTFAWALFRAGAYARAEEVIQLALRYANMGNVAVILEHAGDIASALGKWSEAERYYRFALELDDKEESELSPQCARKRENALEKSNASAPGGGKK